MIALFVSEGGKKCVFFEEIAQKQWIFGKKIEKKRKISKNNVFLHYD